MNSLDKYIGLQKGVLTAVEILKPTDNNKYTVVKCLCSKCGKYSEVRLDRLTIQAPYASHYCIHCREDYFLEEAKKKYVGKKNGVLECIDVKQDKEKKAKNGYRTMAICKCSVCGNVSEVRADRLQNSKYIPQSCTYCSADLHRRKTTERYQKVYQCEGEEYNDKIHDASRLHSIIGNAKGRNINFNLSEEQAISILHQDCYYCGKPHADGIDRIDSTKEYSLDNCVPCCGVCNIMKNKFDYNTFFDHIKLIYNRHFNKAEKPKI